MGHFHQALATRYQPRGGKDAQPACHGAQISPRHEWGIRLLSSPPLRQQPRGAERREGRAAPAGSRHRATTDVPVASLHESGHRHFCFSFLILSKQKNKTRSLEVEALIASWVRERSARRQARREAGKITRGESPVRHQRKVGNRGGRKLESGQLNSDEEVKGSPTLRLIVGSSSQRANHSCREQPSSLHAQA